uniref:Uncharacterized protein n=1 Tax=Nelumbo nucifera TaxID=4432 RepID=A0A822Y8K9_NELNU|nr:TPA_asm: hypothetical protein HUJ06_029097 [Nelumbo nucifera]
MGCQVLRIIWIGRQLLNNQIVGRHEEEDEETVLPADY